MNPLELDPAKRTRLNRFFRKTLPRDCTSFEDRWHRAVYLLQLIRNDAGETVYTAEEAAAYLEFASREDVSHRKLAEHLREARAIARRNAQRANAAKRHRQAAARHARQVRKNNAIGPITLVSYEAWKGGRT